MRLTLRTLLAWLDDTLLPNEVRAIGKQVAESPYSQELVERINRVTRQRRLTVPSDKGADALDPNLVSSYLDNELELNRSRTWRSVASRPTFTSRRSPASTRSSAWSDRRPRFRPTPRIGCMGW